MSGLAWFGGGKQPAREDVAILACYDYDERSYVVLKWNAETGWHINNEKYVPPHRWQYITPPPRTHEKKT